MKALVVQAGQWLGRQNLRQDQDPGESEEPGNRSASRSSLLSLPRSPSSRLDAPGSHPTLQRQLSLLMFRTGHCLDPPPGGSLSTCLVEPLHPFALRPQTRDVYRWGAVSTGPGSPAVLLLNRVVTSALSHVDMEAPRWSLDVTPEPDSGAQATLCPRSPRQSRDPEKTQAAEP